MHLSYQNENKYKLLYIKALSIYEGAMMGIKVQSDAHLKHPFATTVSAE
jgi:hypothetical protein